MKWIIITTAIFLFASCQKENNTVSSLSNTSSTFPARSKGPLGVMVENIPENDRILAANELGVSYVRAELTLENFTQPEAYIDSLVNNNFNIVANFNYYGSGQTEPFTKDLIGVTNSINAVLKTFHPFMVAVENEEVNAGYHTGPAQDYINELATATNVLHANNIKVMNGGLTEDVLCILVYRDYLNRGLAAQAIDFATRTMPQAIISDLPLLSNNTLLANRVAFADSLIQAYKNMSFDYINFHWYEPVIARWADAPQNADAATQADTKAMSEVISFLNTATGKPVVSNEAGELNASPGIVQDMLQQFRTSNLPYVLWYSGDGTGTGTMAKAVALNNADGSLRSNGEAFKNFLQTNYGTF